MTLRELIVKVQALIAADSMSADLEVDSEGCDCIEPVTDVRIEDYAQNGTRRILVARAMGPSTWGKL